MSELRLVACALITLAVLATTGCAPRLRIEKQPPFSEAVHPVPRGSSPAVLISTTARLNGTEVATSEAFRNRVVEKVRESGAFSAVFDSPLNGERPVQLRIRANETVDPHTAAAFWKGFLVGFSLFTLSPAIPFSIDYSLDLSMDAEWQDDRETHYQSSAAGYVSMNWFQLFDQTNGMRLTGEVSSAALNSLVNELARDAAVHQHVPVPAAVSGNGAPASSVPLVQGGSNTARQDSHQPLQERLRILRDMHRQGAISDEEYYRKREQLLNEL